MDDRPLDAEAIAFTITCYLPTILEQCRRDNVKVSIESSGNTCSVQLSTGERFAIRVQEVPRGS